MNQEPLSDQEIKTFINCFKDFIQRAEVAELNYLSRESGRKYRQMYYTNEAKRLNMRLENIDVRQISIEERMATVVVRNDQNLHTLLLIDYAEARIIS